MGHFHTFNEETNTRPFLRQYHLFLEALQEEFEVVDETKIIIDHSNGDCYYNRKNYGLKYPKSWIDNFVRIEKDLNFFFSGFYNDEAKEKRDWVNEYKDKDSIIEYSNRGRTIPRNFFDKEFFDKMLRSKFALCPAGHPYKWTYRFYEATLCGAIPILKESDIIEDYDGYKFYIHSPEMKYEYDEKMVKYNYLLSLKRLFI
jgi:hypothetical protein